MIYVAVMHGHCGIPSATITTPGKKIANRKRLFKKNNNNNSHNIAYFVSSRSLHNQYL